ncbi:MAG TPA: A/G-specific adenine glycosylase [Candidatus Sumerlaeota bacterium]|nr:MAG: putative A/G-specific adenine glycosylase YfhQ [candidate division BRC1 bacterium ADurb.BinA292]HOE97559.1 A/G-specific adenine glycosylase [Candidatus Sumerlaeota bacterium]HOR28826.1 A/G-specific adenine glycosylase [Candidatus Sumerlaeota bacterium]HPK01083.1 A/G-specific adenine glycosylase [Candidatus Sumerlaeota bacterium]
MDAPPTAVPPEAVAAIRQRILRWFDEEHRDLPWRSRRSEYGTVVSEFMLQQTQVATVVPYFNAFLEQFPSFEALAEASEEDVLRAWSGLGYYRRARMLKRVAESVVRRHGGKLPRTREELAELPGFGEYTVGAVGSIALGLPLPLVDGNVRRVIGRLFALEEDLTRAVGRKKLWALSRALVDPVRPGDFNEGLMELGATVCVPREPLCLVCPLFESCAARASGLPEAYPRPTPGMRIRQVREVAVVLVRKGRVLALQRGETGAFAGMWELPRLDSREIGIPENLTPDTVLFELARLRIGQAAPEFLGSTRSTFTHHVITTELYRVELAAERGPVRRQHHVAHRWLVPRSLHELPASRSQHKLFELVVESFKSGGAD